MACALTDHLESFLTSQDLTPGLALVQVGNHPASQVYVRHKRTACASVGVESFLHQCPDDVSLEALRDIINALNHDPAVHGILVQLPLPASLDAVAITDLIHPDKDVDGLTGQNQVALLRGKPNLIPCTPLGCIGLLHQVYRDLVGLNIAIVGRSMIVGRPLANLLTALNATVTLTHSQTRHLSHILSSMDVVVAATGIPGLITRQHLGEASTLIDVGIHRTMGDNGQVRLVGDVNFQDVYAHVRAVTPVPGGVGPMTVACLLYNTIRQAARASGLETRTLMPSFMGLPESLM